MMSALSMEKAESEKTLRCGNCKQDIAEANFQLHELHCARHIQLCKKCGEPVPRGKLEEHEEEEHRDVECEYCKRTLPLDQLNNHKNDCTHIPMRCDYCELDYPRCEFDGHEKACGSRTEDCLKCRQKVMLSDMLKHESSGCRTHSTDQREQQQSIQSPPRPSPVEHMMYQRGARRAPPSLLLPKVQNTDRSQPRLNGASNNRQSTNRPNKTKKTNTPTTNNQRSNRGTRRTPPRPASPPVAHSAGPNNSDDESIPCEFCEQQVPLDMFPFHMEECSGGAGGAYHAPPNYFHNPEPVAEPTIPYGMGFGQENTITRSNNDPFTSRAHLMETMISQTGRSDEPKYTYCEYCEFPIEERDYPVHMEICQMEQMQMFQAIEAGQENDDEARSGGEFRTYDPRQGINSTSNNNNEFSGFSPTRHQFGNMDLEEEITPSHFHQDPSTPTRPPVVTHSDEETELIPCEFCAETFPLDELHQHMYDCELNDRIRTPMPSDAALMGRRPAARPARVATQPRTTSSTNSMTASTRTRVNRANHNTNTNNNSRLSAATATGGNRAPAAGSSGTSRSTIRNRGLEGSMGTSKPANRRM